MNSPDFFAIVRSFMGIAHSRPKDAMVQIMPGEDRPRRRFSQPEEETNEVPVIGEDPDAVARSRTSLKRERVNNETALAELAQELASLNEEIWSFLGIPEPTLDTLRDARKIKTHGARARHLRLVRATLRNSDWMALRRRLDLRKMGILVAAPVDERVSEWCEQLLIQGDPALARFMEEFPTADRKRLRQLLRNIRATPIEKRGKARIPLEQALTHALGAKAEDSSD